jgi:photosystem II stability/assembly factor-like uncharacterized protein
LSNLPDKKLFQWPAKALIALVLAFGSAGCWDDVKTEAGNRYPVTAVLLDPTSCSVNDQNTADPADDVVDCQTVYVATDGGGIFKSTDAGQTWDLIVGGLSEWNISEMVMDPKDPATLYAGTENTGLYRSADGGESWFTTASGSAIRSITSIAVDPHPTCLPSPCIYVGSQESGVWVSEDEGASWKQITNGLGETAITAVAVSAYSQSPSDVFAGTEDGHFYVCDQCATFETWSEPLPGLIEKTTASPLVIAINPLNPLDLYVGTSGGEFESEGGVFRSLNGGLNWSEEIIPNEQDFSVREMVFCIQIEPRCAPTVPDDLEDPDDTTGSDGLRAPDLLYAGVYGLSKKSFKEEGLWTNIDLGGLIQAGNNTTSLAMDTLRHTALYAGTLDGFLMKSLDGGVTWERMEIEL